MGTKDWSFDMKKPCDSCPFRSDIPLDGAPGWAHDVLTGLWKGNLRHSCHKTDPKADGFKGPKKTQHCMGFLGFLKNIDGRPGADVMIATLSGELDWNAVPTDGIWRSVDDMMLAYLRKFRDDGLLSPDIVAKLDDRIRSHERTKAQR